MSKETRRTANKVAKPKVYPSSPDLSEDEILPSKSRSFETDTGNKRKYQHTVDKSSNHKFEEHNVGDKQVDNEIDVGADFKTIFDSFNTSISKTLQTKKKRLENFTTGAVQINETKVKALLANHSKQREHLNEELKRNVDLMLEQWDTDLMQSKEMEEKMLSLVQKQIKCIRELQSSQQQRLAALRQTMASFSKEFQEQETKQKQEYDNLQSDLKTELTALQNKLMVETQKEEMANMQKSLRTMLFM